MFANPAAKSSLRCHLKNDANGGENWSAFLYAKGPPIKDVRSQGEGSLSSANKWGSSKFRCRRPHFLIKNYRVFRNLWCVPNKGLRHCGHFAYKKGGGQFFMILCGRFLWAAPNVLESTQSW